MTIDERLRLPCGICGQSRNQHTGSVHGCPGGYGSYWNPDGERDERVWPRPKVDERAGATSAGVCRICDCSDLDACETGCVWVESDLCDTCALMRAELADCIASYLDVAGPMAAREARARILAGVFTDPSGKRGAAHFLGLAVHKALDEVLALICDEAAGVRPPESLIVVPGYSARS
jgi:hypothetical protein